VAGRTETDGHTASARRWLSEPAADYCRTTAGDMLVVSPTIPCLGETLHTRHCCDELSQTPIGQAKHLRVEEMRVKDLTAAHTWSVSTCEELHTNIAEDICTCAYMYMIQHPRGPRQW
jgi:hypothetical protein